MQWINELIGFFIVLLVLLVPLLRKLLIDMKKVQQKQEQVRTKSFPPRPKANPIIPHHTTERKLGQDFALHSELEEWKKASAIEVRQLETKVDPHFSTDVTSSAFHSSNMQGKRAAKKLEQFIERRGIGKKMIIYSEILSPPVSMR